MTTTFDVGPTIGSVPIVPPQHKLSRDVRAGLYPVCPDELLHLVAAEDQLSGVEAELLAPATPALPGFLSRVTDDLVAGKPLPKDFAASARAAVEAEQTRDVALLALRHLQALIAERWARAAADHVDAMLVGLRGELDGLLVEIRSAAERLGDLDLTDPEAVAEATTDQHAAVGALKALRPRYRRLRTLQQRLVETVLERPWNRGPFDGNAWRWADVWESRVGEYRAVAALGAPEIDTRNVLWFRPLIARSDVWLPDLDDLRRAWERARDQQPVEA